jgi:hypothetical protein
MCPNPIRGISVYVIWVNKKWKWGSEMGGKCALKRKRKVFFNAKVILVPK